jgi:hypothetical protein
MPRRRRRGDRGDENLLFICLRFYFSFCWSWTLSWAVLVHGVLLRSTIERCAWRGGGRKQRQQKSNDQAYGNRGAWLRSLLDQGQTGRTGAGTFRAGGVRASGRWTGCGDGGVAGGPVGFSELGRSVARRADHCCALTGLAFWITNQVLVRACWLGRSGAARCSMPCTRSHSLTCPPVAARFATSELSRNSKSEAVRH